MWKTLRRSKGTFENFAWERERENWPKEKEKAEKTTLTIKRGLVVRKEYIRNKVHDCKIEKEEKKEDSI